MSILNMFKARMETVQQCQQIATRTQPASSVALVVRRQAPPIDDLPATARVKADERLRFVRMVNQARKDRRIAAPQAVAFVVQHYADTFPELLKAGKHGVSSLIYNNYRRWAAVVAMGGPENAIRQKLADRYARGQQKPKGPDVFWKYLFGIWLGTNTMPVTVAYDLAVKRLRLDAMDLIPPTLHQAKYQIKHVDRAIRCWAREGEVAFKNKFVDYITRDWDGIAPGDIVVGDSRTFDTRVKVLDPKTGKHVAVRPNICALMDGRSWYFAAWTISATPINSWEIINTLAQYCSRYGYPPMRAYYDNGKDYCATGFSEPLVVDGYEHSIFRELGMSKTNSIPYNARAKTVECAFHEMMNGFDKTFADYLGSSPAQRTMNAAWFDKNPDALPTLAQFTDIFSKWLDEWHQKPKNGRIHAGKSPAQLWAERVQLEPYTEERFRMAFAMPLGQRKVGRGPAVSIGRVLYFCDDLNVDDTIMVKRDHLDPETIHCYTIDGRFIGFASPRKPINAIVDNDADRKLLSDRIARQRHQCKSTITATHDLTGGLHLVSPMEILLGSHDSRLLKMGSITSVKGAAHAHVRYRLANANADQPIEPTPDNTLPADDAIDDKLLQLIHDTRHDQSDEEDHVNFDRFSDLYAVTDDDD